MKVFYTYITYIFKEILQKNARENYQNLSEEEKNGKCQYPREQYTNVFIENKRSQKKKARKLHYAR